MFDKIFTKALERFNAPSKQKEQANLLRISKMLIACIALVLAGVITISISSAAQSRPSTLTVPVGAKVTVKWKNAPKKVTKSKVAWYSGTKKIKSNVANRKSQKYTGKKAATVKVSVKYKGKKQKTDVKKIKFVAVSKLGSISPANTTIKSGQATTINWKGAPSGIDTSQVKWTVSDKNIASITPNGTSAKLSSTKKAGTVTVTLKYYGKTIGTAKVKVTDKADNSDSTTEDSTEQTTEDTSTPYTAQYTYKIFAIRPEYTVYNKGEYYYYLKTDNPDPASIVWLNNGRYCNFCYGYGTRVADIDDSVEKNIYTVGDYQVEEVTSKVPGGYVFSLNADGGTLPKSSTTIVIKEKNPALGTTQGDFENAAHYAKACELQVTITDYDTAYNAEVKRIADEARASSNDFWEQCTIAAEAITRDYEYMKVPKGDGYTTRALAGTLNSKMFTCAGANQLMCDVALELGATEAKQYIYEDGHIDANITYNGISDHRDATPLGGFYFSDEELAAMKVDFTKFQ